MTSNVLLKLGSLSTSSFAKISFNWLKALSLISFQVKVSSFCVNLVRGAGTCAYF